ncbi:MAG: glycosyltransferase family 2 protein [Theionarchaea archaeon]|nr:glycosyltransferase family 2 protein [Theionarchaea archaeon]MBU7036559.1 glycosyltransferase family 2 protein [Theionarchaea archaeon]
MTENLDRKRKGKPNVEMTRSTRSTYHENPSVMVVTLHWGSPKDTMECIQSLYNTNYDPLAVLVVDNSPESDRIDSIRSQVSTLAGFSFQILTRKESEVITPHLTRGITIIANEKNYGFAEGNNIGIRVALRMNPDYVLLLNNDIVVDPSFLTELVAACENNPDVGAAQPKLLRSSDPHYIDSVGQELYSDGAIRDIWFGKKDDARFDTVHEIFGACAAAEIVKGHVLEKVGLFDPDFFLIFEDVDLSWRIRLAGYDVVLVPTSVAYHNRGVSGNVSATTQYYQIRNKLYIVMKYFPLRYIVMFLPSYAYMLLQFIRLNHALGKKSLSSFVKKSKTILLERQRIHTLPHYRDVAEQWIFKTDSCCWLEKFLKKVFHPQKDKK